MYFRRICGTLLLSSHPKMVAGSAQTTISINRSLTLAVTLFMPLTELLGPHTSRLTRESIMYILLQVLQMM